MGIGRSGWRSALLVLHYPDDLRFHEPRLLHGPSPCVDGLYQNLEEVQGLRSQPLECKSTQQKKTCDGGKGERLDNDPSGARYGCFLPDLTGLARRLPAPTSQAVI